MKEKNIAKCKTRSFDIFFDLGLNKRSSKQSLERHCNERPIVPEPDPQILAIGTILGE